MQDESLRKLIISTYQQTVKHAEIPNDLRDSLMVNERVPAFLRNLELELAALPKKYQTTEHVTYTTRELTLFFLNNVRIKAEQMMLSDAEKNRLETNHNKAQVLDRAATTGIIDEEVMSVLEEEN
jgi:hypothetical protein